METDIIKQKIESILGFLSVEAELKDITQIHNGEITKFDIQTNEPYILIGDEGKTLMSLNHIIKKIFEAEC